MNPPLIRIISTGGTIDSSSEYSPDKKSVFHGSHLPPLLAQARLSNEVVLESLMQKDSADITVEDRELILDRCVVASEARIVLTHGTDTLCETARFLGQRGVGNKTVVLVGSFVPFSQPNSDAIFNLGYAVASAHRLQPGVWIAMGGEVFDWDNVSKNKGKGRFERKK